MSVLYHRLRVWLQDCRRRATRAKRSSSVGVDSVDELNQLNHKRDVRALGAAR